MSDDYNVTFNLSKICRLCLSQETDMLQIFDNVNNVQSPPLPVKIMTCASIEVIAGDGLPELICHKCAFHIDSWYGFKKQCQYSDSTLREYITKHHSDSENSDAEDVKSLSPLPEECITRRRPKRKCRRPNLATRRKNADTTTVAVTRKKDIDGKIVINNVAKHNSEEASVYPDPSYEEPDPSYRVKVEMTCVVKEEGNNEKVQSESHDENSVDYLPPMETTRGFLCQVCNRSFSSKSYLRDHQAVHSGERSFICADCGKAFYSDRKLALHIKTHSAERPCLCSVCGKSFREKSDLKKHFRLHSDESPFLCNVCGKTFKTKFYLTRHLMIHTGEKRHICTECGKAFTWRDTLMAHAKVHALERPLACTVCNKGFKRKEDLVRHMRIHTGEKPFVCPYCTRRFSDKWNLTQHVRLHTGQKPYVCTVCNQAFTHNVTLRNHIKQQHSSE